MVGLSPQDLGLWDPLLNFHLNGLSRGASPNYFLQVTLRLQRKKHGALLGFIIPSGQRPNASERQVLTAIHDIMKIVARWQFVLKHAGRFLKVNTYLDVPLEVKSKRLVDKSVGL